MKRIYSKKDFKYYTMLKQIIHDLELGNKNYWWLISDITAYPKIEKYEEMLKEDYLLMNTNELVEMLEEDDFQWIWAVFSVIPVNYTKEEVLQFDLPYVENIVNKEYNPHKDIPKLQHPYAVFEIYAVDSSYMFMITENEELICRFQKRYPMYSEE